MLLVNHALARETPAIFVIFVVSRGSSSKALVLLVRMQIRHFRHFRQKPTFSGGTKARFTKSTVFGTPIEGIARRIVEAAVFLEAPKSRANQSRRKIGHKYVFWQFRKWVKNWSKARQKYTFFSLRSAEARR